ncbi:HAD family hydrolase [Terracoccus luteus]|uniref:Hydroxymethylpyrimidine pyrophosphatase-like HAD family hydrolase n=1 Tax=Terracoccus luteus TaxID=53356 RepID=A0A839PW77_9MICO|nr:HAD family hydrolase [Terracoccus luteus]MBB2988498.1 hypothetical protein [Terracoccus luteus]MCP2174155.1 hypothetical protein [Terracoccus luteus]
MSDLDRTLIYSPSALMLAGSDWDAPRLLCVEVYGGRPLSFVTERAAGLLAQVAETGMLVPTTTRTVEQYQRIHLPGPAPRYAICANGGRLLVDGVEDRDFTAAVEDRLAASAPHAEILDELTRVSDAGGAPAFVEKVRDAAGLFCYAVVNRSMLPSGWLEDLTEFADERAWGVSLQGRKVYLVPAPLTKAAAAAEVAQRLGVSTMAAAGDSLLDGELLEVADRAIRPNHGELADTGWARPHVDVTEADGVAAGEQIAEWMLEQVTTGPWPAGSDHQPPLPGHPN